MPSRRSAAATRPMIGNDPELDRIIHIAKFGLTLIALAVCLPLAAALSGLLAGHGWAWLGVRHWPELARNVHRAPSQPGRWFPATATGPRPSGSAAVLWTLTILFAAAVLASSALLGRAIWGGAGRRGHDTFTAALAARGAARRLTRRGLRKNRAHIRPDLGAARPWRRATATDDGLYVGRDNNTRAGDIRTSHEDTVIAVGPPRSLKSRMLMIRRIAESPGGMLCTSLRSDLLQATITYRSGLGRPVYVLDAADVANWPTRHRWDLIAGCTDTQVAERRAANLVSPAHGSAERRDSEWRDEASTVLKCYLHAAAAGGKTVLDLLAWSANSLSQEPVNLLATSPTAPYWVHELVGRQQMADKTRESVWMNVRKALSSLSQPDVMAFLTPTAAEPGIDIRAAVTQGASVYVLGDPVRPALGRVMTTLVGEILAEQYRVSQSEPSQRLAPPFHNHLDEAANVAAVPLLPDWLSFFGGSGLPTTTIVHSLAQARDVWGPEGARKLWTNSLHKIVLPGLADRDDLEDISAIIGDVWIQTHTKQLGTRGAGYQQSEHQVRAIPPDAIRTLPRATALMIPNALAPIYLKLTPWTTGPLGRQLKAGAEQVGELTGYRPPADDQLDSSVL